MAEATTKLLDYGVLGALVILLLGGLVFLSQVFLRDRSEMKTQIATMQADIIKQNESEKELLITLTTKTTEVIAKNTEAMNNIATKMDVLSEAISDLEPAPSKPAASKRKPIVVKTA